MLKKHLFGDDHEIRYDSIINHDTYTFLRVALEVPRGQDVEALVLLNGKEIGKVTVQRTGTKTEGYYAFRKSGEDFTPVTSVLIREMGKAVAAVITDYVVT